MSPNASGNEVIATSQPGAMATVRTGVASPVDFRVLDVNGDGFISVDEGAANATLSSRFSAIDRNADGRVTRLELLDWAGAAVVWGSR